MAIKSGRDLLDSGRALAGYLREQPQGWLAAHRLMKSLRWDTVHQAPPQEANGKTRLAPPRGDYRAQLKRLYLQQSWTELLDQVERVYAEGVNHFWLDLHWYLYQALSKQPAPQDSWADIVKRDLGMFLERLPGLEVLCWSDGTPFADETTREWITRHVSGNRPQQWLPAPTTASTTADDEILSLEGEALAQADSDGVEQALAWLAARPALQTSVQTGRQRWLLRLLMARVAEQYGKSDLAIHLLGELDASAQRHALAEWEPELNFEVKARLLKLLRLKAQRNDADKPTLARRMEALLAALVAIDPVRAAVLCG
jgi:type VI secretion system protein VasJ